MIAGDAGNQTVSVPVPAVALSTLKMQRGLGITLGVLGLFLVVSMAGIVAAAVRDARLEPGAIHRRTADGGPSWQLSVASSSWLS